jgi:hypothetical protein
MYRQLKQFGPFAPQNMLNWTTDTDLVDAPYTDESWSVMAPDSEGVIEIDAPEASRDIARQGATQVSRIQVGDIIAAAVIDGWPGEPNTTGHADLITDINPATLVNGKCTLNTEVYLMYNSVHDGQKVGVWRRTGDLLPSVDASGQPHDNNHGCFFVIRSLNFTSFDTLFPS